MVSWQVERFKKKSKKIIDNCYVDFYDILYPDFEDSYTFAIDNLSSAPTMNLKPKKRRNLSATEWCKAFDEFMAVYISEYPNLFTDLLTYKKFINELIGKGHNWSYYDIQFRKDRELSHCEWTRIRIDLQLTAANTTTPNSSANNLEFEGESSNKVPKTFCYAYHSKNERCYKAKCIYKHFCPRCSLKHPAFMTCYSHRNQQRWNRSSDKPNANPGQSGNSRQATGNVSR